MKAWTNSLNWSVTVHSLIYIVCLIKIHLIIDVMNLLINCGIDSIIDEKDMFLQYYSPINKR